MEKLEKLLNKADQFKEIGKFEDSLSILNKANKLFPNDPQVHLSIAITYDLMERFSESMLFYSQAIELNPDDPKILTNCGITLCRTNNYEKAVKLLKNSLSLDPDYLLTKWHLGLAYKYIGIYEEAIGLLEDCLNKDENQFIDEIHYQLGICYFDMGWTGEAMTALEKHLEIFPDDPWANLSLGNCFFDLGWVDESIRKFQEIINCNMGFIPSYNALAISYAEKGWYKEALDILREAQKIAPEDQTVKDNIDYIQSLIDDGNNSFILLNMLIEICKLRQRHKDQSS